MAKLIVPFTREENEARLKQARADKMEEIGKTAVACRKRKFKAFPHVPMAASEWGRFGDLTILLAAGRRTESDTWVTRNLRLGHYKSDPGAPEKVERILIKDLLDEMEAVSLVREQIRIIDQSYRDRVDKIFNDTSKSPEKRKAEIEAVIIPKFLGVDVGSTAEKMVMLGVKDG